MVQSESLECAQFNEETIGIVRYPTDLFHCFNIIDTIDILPETSAGPLAGPVTAIDDIYIYVHDNTQWTIRDNCLLMDVVRNKYYIPVGLLKISSGTVYKWLPIKSNKTITYNVLSKIKQG